MKTVQETPRKIARPPSIGASAYTAGVQAYEAIAFVAPDLLPPETVRIALASHRFAKLAPKPTSARNDAIGQWRADLHAAVLGDDPDPAIPSLDGMIRAASEELASRELAGLFATEWSSTLGPLGRIIAADGDQIVLGLRAIHDQSWAQFIESHSRFAQHKDAESLLQSGDVRSIDAWKTAGTAISRWAATRSARVRLHALPGYAVNCREDATIYRNPIKARALRLPKGETLSRWHALTTEMPLAEPYIFTKAELETFIEDQKRKDAA